MRIERLGPQYETCNIAYPRALLEALHGFDERFGCQPAGEDTDLAWRAIAAGHEAVFVSAALVHHAVEPDRRGRSLRRAARWSAVVRVYADHPATRAMLYRGRFWNVWHYLLYRSLLALAGPPWLRRLLVTRHLLALRPALASPALGRRAPGRWPSCSCTTRSSAGQWPEGRSATVPWSCERRRFLTCNGCVVTSGACSDYAPKPQ